MVCYLGCVGTDSQPLYIFITIANAMLAFLIELCAFRSSFRWIRF